MTIQTLNTANRDSGNAFGRIADRLGMFALLAMGLALGGVTALAGI